MGTIETFDFNEFINRRFPVADGTCGTPFFGLYAFAIRHPPGFVFMVLFGSYVERTLPYPMGCIISKPDDALCIGDPDTHWKNFHHGSNELFPCDQFSGSFFNQCLQIILVAVQFRFGLFASSDVLDLGDEIQRLPMLIVN